MRLNAIVQIGTGIFRVDGTKGSQANEGCEATRASSQRSRAISSGQEAQAAVEGARNPIESCPYRPSPRGMTFE